VVEAFAVIEPSGEPVPFTYYQVAFMEGFAANPTSLILAFSFIFKLVESNYDLASSTKKKGVVREMFRMSPYSCDTLKS
jgi:hypothetical protein